MNVTARVVVSSHLSASSGVSVTLVDYRSILAGGLILAAAVAILRGRRHALRPARVFDGLLAAAGGGLLLGRAVYALANWAYFAGRPLEALQFWRGGLSASGALIGAGLAVWLWCRVRGEDPRPLLDALAPGAAVVAIAAWLGCLVRGSAWGVEVWPDQGALWLLRVEWPDLYGLVAPRVPVQACGMVWNAAILTALLVLGRRGRPFPLWLLLHAVGDLGLGFLRGDVTPVALGLAAGQMADLAFVLIGLLLLATPAWRRQGERTLRCGSL
jgi:phosphatidylglycerol:prolipoprotein diacylglycerol transferase